MGAIFKSKRGLTFFKDIKMPFILKFSFSYYLILKKEKNIKSLSFSKTICWIQILEISLLFCHFFVYWAILINNSSKCSFLWVLSTYISKIVFWVKNDLSSCLVKWYMGNTFGNIKKRHFYYKSSFIVLVLWNKEKQIIWYRICENRTKNKKVTIINYIDQLYCW